MPAFANCLRIPALSTSDGTGPLRLSRLRRFQTLAPRRVPVLLRLLPVPRTWFPDGDEAFASTTFSRGRSLSSLVCNYENLARVLSLQFRQAQCDRHPGPV